MSLILVVDRREGSLAAQIEASLVAEGWRVEFAKGPEALDAGSGDRSLALVLVNDDMPGTRDVVATYARAAGGPGVLVLSEPGKGPKDADAVLEKPFTDPQLRAAVRRCMSRAQRAATQKAAAQAASSGAQLTSKDLFGDMLAEVEQEFSGREVARQRGDSDAPKAKPTPQRESADDVEKKLEATLSGVLGKQGVGTGPRRSESGRPRVAKGEDVEALLDQTLSGLGVASRRPKTERVPATPDSQKAAPAGSSAQSAPPAPPAVGPDAAPSVPPESPPVAKPAEPPREAKGTPPQPAVESPAVKPAAVEPPAVQRPPAPVPAPPAAAEKKQDTVSPPTQAASQKSEPEVAPPAERPAPFSPTPVVTPQPAAGAYSTQRLQTVKTPVSKAEGEPGQFGQYTLLERVAVGGMAEVWKARMKGMEGFQKTVAIKKILPHLTDSVDFVTMFIDEAKLAAQLNHPSIIHIYDLGKIESDYYIAMEYVEGKDLRSILNTARKRDQPLPHGLALLVAARLASGLDYAHRKRDFDDRELGLVHRDVSPQNVLISYEGDIKLCDFGIVKAVAKASKTQMGALKGKLQYMSPEQAWGRVVDSRSDIFSLGAVLFEMLTGKRLFAGDSEISVLEAVRDCRIRSPRELAPDVPEAVERIVMKALAQDPDERFQTAGEMQKELEEYLFSLKPMPGQGELADYMRALFGQRAAATTATESEVVPDEKPPAAGEEVVAVAPAGELEPEEKRGLGWLAMVAAAVVVVLAGSWFFLRGKGPGEHAVEHPAVTQAATTPPVQAAPPAPAPATQATSESPAGSGSTQAGTQSKAGVDVAGMVDAQLRQKEEQMRKQFEEKRKKLEKELQAVKQEPPAKRADQKGAQKTSEEGQPGTAVVKPTEKPAGTTPPPKGAPPAQAPGKPAVANEASAGKPQAMPGPAQSTATENAASDTSATSGDETGAPPAAAETPVAGGAPAQKKPEKAAPASPPPQPAAPAIREGQLVEAGTAALQPPVLVSIQKPQYPPLAQRLRVQGTVVVSVLVDENGQVVESRLLKGVSQNVGLNEAAERAAKTARFKPASLNGTRVKTWFNLNIPFRL